MLTKRFLTISLVLPLVAISSAALAGATISDKRYWPTEAVANASSAGARNDISAAFASVSITPHFQDAMQANEAGDAWRYHGGPKSR